ncbi:MAG: hypothetical protein PHT37_01330 [Candidatus Cloacimonetes bacterium]|nr:hypothetical protein [Candidatus Cloacimonadota bacterium]MDD4276520.1 hypothetical protein [Candidatus Cloacimonadota bacterium]
MIRKYQALLRTYRNRINIGIALRAIVGSALLFGCGVHLYFILWLILGAYSPALIYANIAIRAALALTIIFIIWMAYRDLWGFGRLTRYLDARHGLADDLYQNTWELWQEKGENPITTALLSSATKRLDENTYKVPKVFGGRNIILIILVGLAFGSFWYFQKADFSIAFRQFYTNKAPKIIYKEDIILSPGNITIGKNQQVLIKIDAPDPRLKHRLYFRTGESWRELGLSQNSYLFSRLEGSIEYYAENEITKSPIYKIKVLDEPIVRRWQVTYDYPAYTGIPDFSDSLSYGNIEAYQGTKVTLKIQGNIPLKRASMVFSDASRKDLSPMDATNFITQLTLTNPDQWYLEIEDELGRKSRPEEKQIRILPDDPPQIRIIFPGEDLTLNQNLMLPLIISANDDFGLANFSLHYQINAKEPVAVNIQNVIPSKLYNTDYLWNMNPLDLFPGDVVTYWVEIYDNAPTPQKGVSTRYRARFPSIEEIYAEIESQENIRKDELSTALKESEKIQERFEQKRRELLKDPTLEWEDKKQLEDILQNQQDLAEQVENIADSFQDLIDKMQANSTLSQDTLQKMMKIQELMQEIANEDLLKAMRDMEKAMQNVSPEDLRKAMENFKFSMEDFAKKIEQTLALLESIKNEQAVQKALQISEEMEKMQKALSEKTADKAQDNQKLADEQGQISDKYENLQKELEALKKQLASDPKASKMLEELLKDMKQSKADQDMKDSQQALESNKRSQSQQSQGEALEKLRRFTLKLAAMKESMSSGSQGEMMQAIGQAIRELLIFSKEHEDTKSRYENDPYPLVPELIAAYEGLQISLNQLFSKPQVSMVLPPKFYIDLTSTNKAYRDIFGVLGQAYTPNIRKELDAVQQGLNLMAYDLMLAQQNASSGGGGGGGMESLMQMLGQMGQEQMAINMLTEQLMMQMQAQGGKMSPAMQDQIQKLASDQERLAENLKRALQQDPEAQKQGNAIKQIIEEAESVARNLRQNRFDPAIMKQQENILSRLLDAQRSITKRDTSERRKAESSTGLPSADQIKAVDYDALRRAMMLDDGFKNYPREYQQLIMEYLKILQEGGQ